MSKVCWCIEHVWCVVCRYWFVEISRQQMAWLNIVVQTSHKSRCLCHGWLSFWMQLLIATFIRSVCTVPRPLSLTAMTTHAVLKQFLQAGCHS